MSKVNKAKVNPTEPKKAAGSFFQNNQRSITFILGGVVVLVFLYLGYQKLYLAPRAERAANLLYKAEEFVQIDSVRRAIEGDGSFLGFKQIAEEYSNTKSANIANAYLGGLYLREGKYEEAIRHLQLYSATRSDILDPLVLGLLGDAYSESGDYKNAANYYKNAANKSKNSYTSPLFLKKLGLVYEALEDFKNAEKTYQAIKSDYPNSTEAAMIDGAIARAQAKK